MRVIIALTVLPLSLWLGGCSRASVTFIGEFPKPTEVTEAKPEFSSSRKDSGTFRQLLRLSQQQRPWRKKRPRKLSLRKSAVRVMLVIPAKRRAQYGSFESPRGRLGVGLSKRKLSRDANSQYGRQGRQSRRRIAKPLELISLTARASLTRSLMGRGGDLLKRRFAVAALIRSRADRYQRRITGPKIAISTSTNRRNNQSCFYHGPIGA